VLRWDWTMCSDCRRCLVLASMSESSWEVPFDCMERKGIFTLTSYGFCTSTAIPKTWHDNLCDWKLLAGWGKFNLISKLISILNLQLWWAKVKEMNPYMRLTLAWSYIFLHGLVNSHYPTIKQENYCIKQGQHTEIHIYLIEIHIYFIHLPISPIKWFINLLLSQMFTCCGMNQSRHNYPKKPLTLTMGINGGIINLLRSLEFDRLFLVLTFL
jgi:hypothetical protein